MFLRIRSCEFMFSSFLDPLREKRLIMNDEEKKQRMRSFSSWSRVLLLILRFFVAPPRSIGAITVVARLLSSKEMNLTAKPTFRLVLAQPQVGAGPK